VNVVIDDTNAVAADKVKEKAIPSGCWGIAFDADITKPESVLKLSGA
jgi:hypothetical protein